MRRSLGLSGLISADFKADAVPTVLVDDATRPGCNIARGRNWSYSPAAFPVQGAGGLFRGIVASNPIILDRITVSTNPSPGGVLSGMLYSQWSFFQASAAMAQPFAMATAPTATFTELTRSQTDRPPFLTGTGAGVGTAVSVGTLIINPLTSFSLDLKIELEAGDMFFVWVIPDVVLANPADGFFLLQGRNF
jgi:hypothetical protein